MVTSENPATPPKICPILNITSRIHRLFVESSETMSWSKGDEFDRLSCRNYDRENAWCYKVLSPEDVEDVVSNLIYNLLLSCAFLVQDVLQQATNRSGVVQCQKEIV